MNKLLSRIILGFTALSAVFFTSSVFAYDVKYAADLTPYYENAGTVNRPDGSRLIARLPGTYNVNRFESYGWWRTVRFGNSSNYNSPNAPYVYFCKNQASGYENVSTATYDGFQEVTSFNGGTVISVIDYGNYLFVDGTDYDAYIARHNCSSSSTLAGLGTLPPAPTPPVTPCTTDTIASGGNCSCKNTGTYTASASGAVKMPWTYDGIDISSSLSFSIEQQSFASTKTDYVALKYTPSGSFKAPRIMGKVDMSGITGTKVDPIMFNNLGTTGSIAPYSGSGIQNPTTTASNAIYIETYDGDNIDSLISSPFGDNSSDDPDNLFNSFYIHATTGYPSSRYFDAYYSDVFNSNSLNPLDLKWEFLGTFSANQYVNLPYGKKTRKVKIVPRSTSVYFSAVSLWNVSFTPDKVCSVLSGDALTAELASRSTLSGSTNIANVNFCGSAFEVPYIGSALGAMCNFVQPLIKPLVGGFQTTVDMINIVPPSTAPTTFDYYPSFTFSGMTMHISTQTGAIPVYSSGSDVNPLKITSNEASSNMKIGVLALISIILYLVVYALHFGIVAGLVWLLLHISRFFTGFLGKHSGTGNIWSLAPFLVYAGVFFTALLSIIASVSFLLPLLQVVRAYALFLITWLTSFAPGSYALFSGFYIVVFSSIFLVGTFYLIYVLFEKHSRLN